MVKLIFSNSRFIQYFNQQNSSHEIDDCENFKEFEFEQKKCQYSEINKLVGTYFESNRNEHFEKLNKTFE